MISSHENIISSVEITPRGYDEINMWIFTADGDILEGLSSSQMVTLSPKKRSKDLRIMHMRTETVLYLFLWGK